MNNIWKNQNKKNPSNSISTSSKNYKNNNHNHHQSKNNINVLYDHEESENALSNHMKLVRLSMKFSLLNSENNGLHNENSNLKKLNHTLLRNIHEMNPGFTSNTSNSFPMITEIQNKVNDFIKLTCQDIFFDFLLDQELKMNQIIYFYQISFTNMIKEIHKYFNPLEKEINHIMNRQKLALPIYNVLKKAYQENYTNIAKKIDKERIDYKRYALEIGESLDLNEDNMIETIVDFLKQTASLCLICYLSEPEIFIEMEKIGMKVNFNSLEHDAIDGFIRAGQGCYVLLPAFYKGEIKDCDKSKDNMIAKMQVISEGYEFDY